MASARQIHVGNVPIGGGAPVAVQTMTKTETANLQATLDQVLRVADAGADIVRLAVPRDKDVDALKTIIEKSPIPIIADIRGLGLMTAMDVGKAPGDPTPNPELRERIVQTAFHKVSEAMYERAQSSQQAEEAANGASSNGSATSSDEEVVDAEVVDEK